MATVETENMRSNTIHVHTKIDFNENKEVVNDYNEEDFEKTPHHNITRVLRVIACSPTPNDISDVAMKTFKKLIENKSYKRDDYIEIISTMTPYQNYDAEQLEDFVERLEASRGYSLQDIKTKYLDKMRDDHGYDNSQMTKIFEKLNETDQYAILHYATIFNNVPFCKIVIEDYGCNINLVGWDGETPLHIAARLTHINKQNQTKDESILLYLLSQPKIDKNIQDSEGRTALHIAVMYNCYYNAKYLIENGCKLNVADIQGAIPLHYTCRFHQNKELVNLFLVDPELFNYETKDKKRPIDIAAEYGNLDIFRDLFRSEDFQKVNQSGIISTLINAAVSHRESDILSFLKEQHSHLIHRHTNTLHFACRQFHGHKMVSHLINENSIVYQDIETGSSPLMVAVQHRQLECVKQLLSRDDFAQKQIHLISSITLRTVFHICAEINRDDITEVLCQPNYLSNSLIIAADLEGDTPLHICAKVGNAFMCQKLINYMKNNSSSSNSMKVTPYSTTHQTIINSDANSRVSIKPASIKTYTTTGDTSHDKNIEAMLMKKNKDKYIPLHVAIQNGNINVIQEILSYFVTSKIIDACDDQKRTCLHMAAEKGHVDILDILLNYHPNADACDINDWTPLHDAAQSSIYQEDNKERAKCIEILVNKGKANINALNIRRETPLHIACEYGSKSLIKCLRKLGADLFATNVNGYNCLEVAIKEGNEEVVRYLIDDDDCGFDLMRNAQIREKESFWSSLCNSQRKNSKRSFLFDRQRKADTPMRKLILEMPKMALLVLNKCSMTIGSNGTNVHKNIFVYEFLEDQYNVNDWEKGNFGVHRDRNSLSTLYTTNKVDLVRNHPLFMMGECDLPDLMSHPLSAYLAKQKFYKFGIYMFSIFILFYITYLGLLTTVSLRTQDPQTYYNQTNFANFDDSLCYNVSQALINGSSGAGGIKTKTDYVLKYILYVLIWLHILKNIIIIIEIVQNRFKKTWNYWMEMSAVALSFSFIYDQSWQTSLTFRCPFQWQYGALALFLSWLCLLHYIQFFPVIGIYVSMLWVICKKFVSFLVVIIILITGFSFAFHMIYPNFDVFTDAGLSLIKTALMVTGDMTYEDQMYNSTQ